MSLIYKFVQKYLFWLIVAAILFGLFLVRVTGGYSFSPALCALAALIMIYPSLVPLEFNRIKEIKKYKKIIILSVVINFVIVPIVAVLIGWIFLQQEPMLWLGLILLSILPGGGMVTTWAYKSKADMPLTVGIVFVNILLAVLLVPFYLTFAINRLTIQQAMPLDDQMCALEPITNGSVNCLFDASGSVSPLKIALPILVIIVFPLLLAYFTQKYFAKRYDKEQFNAIKQQFAAFSNIGLLVILFALMGIKQNIIIFERPDLLLKALFPLIVFYVLSIGISWILYKYKKGSVGKAIAWGTYLRYITLALGLAISLVYQNPDYNLVVIIVILAYLVKIPSSFWLAKKFKTKENN